MVCNDAHVLLTTYVQTCMQLKTFFYHLIYELKNKMEDCIYRLD